MPTVLLTVLSDTETNRRTSTSCLQSPEEAAFARAELMAEHICGFLGHFGLSPARGRGAQSSTNTWQLPAAGRCCCCRPSAGGAAKASPATPGAAAPARPRRVPKAGYGPGWGSAREPGLVWENRACGFQSLQRQGCHHHHVYFQQQLEYKCLR